jgi:SAM-dependent methyltransferase
MTPAQDEKLRFGFGKNWQRFVPVVDERRIALAKDSLVSFFEMPDFSGKSFVDIGSGSGLFSYAAYLLGAERIVSFDYDQHSVDATTALWEQAGKPAHWTVVPGSALDPAFLDTLGTFDIVYSWGVLHHTGAMWDAITNTARMTKPGGLYCIALYNRVVGRFGSAFWLRVKERYNRGGQVTRTLIEWLYILVYFTLAPLARGKNPLRVMREYGEARGMHYRRDVADWVGGYPYEAADTEEVFAFMKKEFPSFQLVNLKVVPGLGNNTFLFKRTS